MKSTRYEKCVFSVIRELVSSDILCGKRSFMSSNCDRLQEWQGNMTKKEKCLRTHLNTSYRVLRSGKGHKRKEESVPRLFPGFFMKMVVLYVV